MEEQLVLRLPPHLAELVSTSVVEKIGGDLVDFKMVTPRLAEVIVLSVAYPGVLMDLPTVVETHKVAKDQATLYKVGNVGQVLVVYDPSFPDHQGGWNNTVLTAEQMKAVRRRQHLVLQRHAARVQEPSQTPRPPVENLCRWKEFEVPKVYRMRSGLTPPTANIGPYRFDRRERYPANYVRVVEQLLLQSDMTEELFHEVQYDGQVLAEEQKRRQAQTPCTAPSPRRGISIKVVPSTGPAKPDAPSSRPRSSSRARGRGRGGGAAGRSTSRPAPPSGVASTAPMDGVASVGAVGSISPATSKPPGQSAGPVGLRSVRGVASVHATVPSTDGLRSVPKTGIQSVGGASSVLGDPSGRSSLAPPAITGLSSAGVTSSAVTSSLSPAKSKTGGGDIVAEMSRRMQENKAQEEGMPQLYRAQSSLTAPVTAPALEMAPSPAPAEDVTAKREQLQADVTRIQADIKKTQKLLASTKNKIIVSRKLMPKLKRLEGQLEKKNQELQQLT